MISNKILLVGTDRKYFYVEKDKSEGLKKDKDYVLTTDFLPYGFEFKFGGGKDISFGYGSLHFPGLSDEEIIDANLNLTIKGLEEMVEEAKADFMLLDDLNFMHGSLDGRGRLLIKR
jgi:hypothetical protein